MFPAFLGQFKPMFREKPEQTRSAPIPQNYQKALASLRDKGFIGAADALKGRVDQTNPKMKIDEKRAVVVANYLLENLPNMPKTRELERVMPRSAVELVVAVAERGVSREEAERISGFLLRFTAAMRFQNLRQFDSNHSNVIGREWSEIDYSGEGTTWQQRKRQWEKFGVPDFKTAQSIENYFTREKKLGYFSKIYRPEGQWP